MTVFRIRPKKIAHRAFVRNFLHAIKFAHIVECFEGGRESSMKAEHLVSHNCSQGQVVKQVGQELPDVSVAILAEALIVEAIYLGDLTTLVVAA